MTIKETILHDIEEKGYFMFSPGKWDTFGSAIKELEEKGIIGRLLAYP